MAENNSMAENVESIPEESKDLPNCDQLKNEINDNISDDQMIAITSSVTSPPEVSQTRDVFEYTRRGQFTSETFKIEIKNLPKHIGYDVSLDSII